MEAIELLSRDLGYTTHYEYANDLDDPSKIEDLMEERIKAL